MDEFEPSPFSPLLNPENSPDQPHIGFISLLSRQLDNATLENEKPDQPYSLIVNISIHVIILFSILSFLFFLYISKITRAHVDKEFKHIIEQNMDKYLRELIQEQDPSHPIPWSVISQESQRLLQKYQQVSPQVQSHNAKIRRNVIIALGVMLGLLLLAIGIMKYYGKKLSIMTIIFENIIIFVFVGIIELLFFKFIASKYIPLNKTDVLETLVSRMIYNLQRQK